METYGKVLLCKARDEGRCNDSIVKYQYWIYASRQYFWEDIPFIVMVSYVASRLGELNTVAILSLVGNVGMVIGSIVYST